jgi:hypothetical protein
MRAGDRRLDGRGLCHSAACSSRLQLGAELRAGEGRLEVTVDAPSAQGARSTTRSTINKPLPVTHITLGDGDQLTLSEPRAVRHGRARERAD